jgi:mRNA-degrading endonuclease RelE of RelBE toxin-antitoxin system
MTAASPPPTEVRFTPEFKRNLHALAKKYRHIRSDLEPIIERLRNGERPGDRIPGVAYAVYKVRVRNRDTGKGTRGGYRLLYCAATPPRSYR